MTSFRTIGPGSFECLEPDCEYPITPNPAGHAIRVHDSSEVITRSSEVSDLAESSEKASDTDVIRSITPIFPEEKPVPVYFRRREFHGEYQGVTPKWHIHVGDYPGRYGTYVGYCGYERKNILGDMAVKRSKRSPKRETMCKKCLSELKDPA